MLWLINTVTLITTIYYKRLNTVTLIITIYYGGSIQSH